MSLPDSPDLAHYYCPTCEPETNPLVGVNTIRWCVEHTPTKMDGLDDPDLPPTYFGNTEAGGEENRRMCAWVHRRRNL